MNVVWEPIIAAILAITNFSIKANPKAPDANVVLEYAVEDADFVIHVDWQPTVADNYATFSKLADDPVIKQVPELRDAITQGLAQAEGGRGMAKGMMGFDPITDLTSFTAFAKVSSTGKEPEFVVVARGKFAADLPSKIAKTAGGKESKVDGRAAASMSDGTMIGLSKNGSLVAGKADWVMARIKDDWKAPARSKVWGRIATALDAKPFFLVASKPSADAIKLMTKELDTQSFGKDLITGHELVVVSASSTGIGWVFQARDAAFAKRIKASSEGLIELMRAAHLAPRGMMQMAFAALPSYAHTSKGIDAVIASKDKLMAAMWDMTGDGRFAATVKLDGTTVIVTTKGKRISDVVPASMLVGFGAVGFLSARGGGDMTPAKPPVRPGAATPRSGVSTPIKPVPAKPAPQPHH